MLKKIDNDKKDDYQGNKCSNLEDDVENCEENVNLMKQVALRNYWEKNTDDRNWGNGWQTKVHYKKMKVKQ